MSKVNETEPRLPTRQTTISSVNAPVASYYNNMMGANLSVNSLLPLNRSQNQSSLNGLVNTSADQLSRKMIVKKKSSMGGPLKMQFSSSGNKESASFMNKELVTQDIIEKNQSYKRL